MLKEDVINFNKKNVSTGKSPRNYGHTYFAKKDFRPGETVMMGFGKIINHQTSHLSVQIGFHKHFLPTKWTSRYWNHSCNPSCFVKTRDDGFPNLVALKKIKKGEEITFAYWMTEYQWAKNAAENQEKCKCGSKSCKGKILSFSQLSKKDKIKHKEHISKYLHGAI